MKSSSIVFALMLVVNTVAVPLLDIVVDVELLNPYDEGGFCGQPKPTQPADITNGHHRHNGTTVTGHHHATRVHSHGWTSIGSYAETATALPTSGPSSVFADRPASVIGPENYTSTSTSTMSSAVSSAAPPISTNSSPFNNKTAPLRGVNVGHWLVIEPWMDDGSLITGKFQNVADQWSFDKLDTNGSVIKAHWDTWFTEADVQTLKGYGFNALRIPIGYWAVTGTDNTPYHQGSAEYMDKAIVWARNAGMKVLIDCHGSPGSQNGQMHSGHQGAVEWQLQENLNMSTKALQLMVQRWGTQENADIVFAIEIVNEPTANTPNVFSVSQKWAYSTYQILQQTISNNGLNKNLQIITHDSFMGIKKFISGVSMLTSPIDSPTFGVDQHDYQLYTTGDNALDQPGHIKKACGWAADLSTTRKAMPTYVGEWSALTNICIDSNNKTFPLNAGQTGPCTTQNTSNWSDGLIEQVRRYVEAQLDVFEANSNGHFIWSFKAGGGWGLYNLINIGAFPQPITTRKYPGQCS